ncbi:hypothetical protein LTR56_001021 [Elasticomyces elasticus]|nr:hypothetical protein LTR22_013237 [Elasticomyces elasticus]KAK3660095.1 hypothetical protein LTR56_001021 [Elasticomyces elasticus]KAK4906977.1 hypothetical protein LTR49_023950 [Elasticomyces elasticus]KAK5747067.1 hypothetical protein LTS12_022487 [Elasticomyces elasticus]
MASSGSGSGESSPSPEITPQTTTTPAASVPTLFQLDHDQIDLTMPAIPTRRTSAQTSALYNTLHRPSNGVFVNVGQTPAGSGYWVWMTDDDRANAETLGLLPREVEMMRLNGIFTQGRDEWAGPFTVWYPEPQFFNPVNEPAVEGRFEYHTTHDRDLAELNFGGQEVYGLGPHPTATQIWRIRNVFVESEDEDKTAGINLVWVAADSEPNTISPMPAVPTGDLELTEEEGHGADQIDPNSGERHAPTNRGENDQTGSATANYHTNVFGGVPHTLDRSRAHATVVEPRKTWIVTNKGVWQQWTGAKTLDWSNKNEVEKLNKWKEQALTRHDWPPKRTGVRPPYTAEQKAWLMDRVKEERRTGRTLSNEQVTLDFNARFNETRSVTGITAILHRTRLRLSAEIEAQEERDAPTS